MAEHANLGTDSYLMLLSDPGLLAVLFISIIGTMGNNVVSPALPAVTSALGVSEARIGLLITAYTLPAMVFVPITSTAADMYGRRTVILPALVVFGAAGTALAGTDTFQTMLLLRAIQGAAVAGFMPLTVTLLGDLYSGDIGATAQGLRVGANGIGGIIVPFAAGALAGLAWNYPFLLYAVAFLVFVFGYTFLPETMDSIGVDTETDMTATFAWYARSLRAQLAERDLAVLLTGGFARDFPRYAVITFVPLFAVQALGANFAEAGAILSIRGLISLVVSPSVGSFSERFSHKWILFGAISVSAGGILFIAAAPSLIWLAMAVGVYSVGDAAFSPVVKNTLTDATTNEYRSGVVGGMQLVKYSAQTASPAVFGLILAVTGFDVLFACAATVAGAYAIIVLALFERG
jgi:ACDE family multidrug resistance protein